MASKICSLPSLSVTTKVTVLPGSASVVPEISGVSSLLLSGATTEITGAVVSRVALSEPSGLMFPAESITVATTSIVSPSCGAGNVKSTEPLSISS
ncbi:hypothetical protein AN944_01138 [Shewanella sp. P1-14-1]|nr:hypothetical protein AN944_01138 [Shewanella sp. P1-14-1]